MEMSQSGIIKCKTYELYSKISEQFRNPYVVFFKHIIIHDTKPNTVRVFMAH